MVAGCFGGPPFATGILATGIVPGATYGYQPIEEQPEVCALPSFSSAFGSSSISAAQFRWEMKSQVAEKVLGLQTICERHGVPLAAAALQFPIAHP